MPDVVTGSAAYATAADLFVHVDWRIVADWVTDLGVRPTRASLLDSSTPAGSLLVAKLKAASGELESACLRGGRYTVADLQALTGNTREYLRAVVSSLALWQLARRRNPGASTQDVPGAQSAIEALESLRTGDTIFGLVDQVDAGAGTDAVTQVVSDGSDTSRVVTIAARYFGNRDRG